MALFSWRQAEAPAQPEGRVYLIDTENVRSVWTLLLDNMTEQDKIYVFFTMNSGNVSYENLNGILSSGKQVELMECFTGKNGLDFQLVSYLGYLLKENGTAEYIIISDDGGYDAALKFWEKKGMKVSRKTASEVSGKPAPKAKKSPLRKGKSVLSKPASKGAEKEAEKKSAGNAKTSDKSSEGSEAKAETKSSGKVVRRTTVTKVEKKADKPVAEADMQKAENAQKAAEAEKQKAENAQKAAEAEKQKEEAAKRRAEAEKQKEEAAQKRAEAEKQKAESSQKAAEADQQKEDAQRTRAEAEKSRRVEGEIAKKAEEKVSEEIPATKTIKTAANPMFIEMPERPARPKKLTFTPPETKEPEVKHPKAEIEKPEQPKREYTVNDSLLRELLADQPAEKVDAIALLLAKAASPSNLADIHDGIEKIYRDEQGTEVYRRLRPRVKSLYLPKA
jgi:hypothetical protein